ncbi:MAG: hypothetical protein IPH80_08445 [Myxococcales bacterium]|mgnify:CR=1 FL=1|jgi:hypothetical protein|nr:hypothetical protein [Myxococcales bacterium]MBP6846301.1 hypothetical protein [Kofleriaceae bacterium]
MRTAAAVLGCSILTAACRGPSKPAPTGPGNATGATGASAPAALGTTGLPGLDWGATTATVLARYPGSTASADGVTARGAVDGRPAVTVFTIGEAGLAHVKTVWSADYPSMEACARDWDARRVELDARLGESSAENLAAFWDTATTTITFFCDPGDGETSDRSVLAITYGPRLDQ